MINTITIQPPSGINYAYDPTLAFVKVVVVSNETGIYSIGTGTPAGTLCQYVPADGRVNFGNDFDGTQRVFIIYKT